MRRIKGRCSGLRANADLFLVGSGSPVAIELACSAGSKAEKVVSSKSLSLSLEAPEP